MSIEDQAPEGQLLWTDPDTGINGYLVIHNLVNDLCTGGTRMRAGCTMSEVGDLARGMALKAAMYDLPVGGAKGGIDCDPKDERAEEVRKRFFSFVRARLDANWVTAEDLGVTQEDIDKVFESLGLGQSFHAAIMRSEDPEATLERVHRDMSILTDDGYKVSDIAGGYGVAQACLGAIDARGLNPSDVTVAIQGVGTMGGGAAWYLQEAGVKIVAVADVDGVLYNDKGLDVGPILDARDKRGKVDRSDLDPDIVMDINRDAILGYDVDIFIPAATSYAITQHNVAQISASIVVEAANAATTPDAEITLADNRTIVIPDFVANAGAVVWAWWMLFGWASGSADDILGDLRDAIRPNAAKLVEEWDSKRIPPRVTASWIADKNVSSSIGKTVVVP